MASIKYLSIEGRNFDDEHDVEITDEMGAQGGGQGWEVLAWREQRTVVTSKVPSADIELGLNGTSSKWGDHLFFPFY